MSILSKLSTEGKAVQKTLHLNYLGSVFYMQIPRASGYLLDQNFSDGTQEPGCTSDYGWLLCPNEFKHCGSTLTYHPAQGLLLSLFSWEKPRVTASYDTYLPFSGTA